MRKTPFVWLLLAGLIPSSIRASGPDYLTDEFPPADQASKLPTPFTPLPEEKPYAGLFKSVENPFIRDIDFTLAPRLYFRSLQNSTGVNSTFAGGGFLGMTTGWLADTLQLGVVGYTTILLASNQTGRDRTGLVGADGNGFAVLGQAWGKLKFGPVLGTFYRQELELPFIHGDDSRIIPNTFEAYQVEITPLDYLRFNLGYVTRIKRRNSSEFVPMSEAAGAPQVNRGTAFFGFVLGHEDRTYLEAINETTFDLFNGLYAQTGHTWHLTPELELRGDLQFADQRSVGSNQIGVFATQFFGAQLATSYGGAVLTLAYNRTGKSAAFSIPIARTPRSRG